MGGSDILNYLTMVGDYHYYCSVELNLFQLNLSLLWVSVCVEAPQSPWSPQYVRNCWVQRKRLQLENAAGKLPENCSRQSGGRRRHAGDVKRSRVLACGSAHYGQFGYRIVVFWCFGLY